MEIKEKLRIYLHFQWPIPLAFLNNAPPITAALLKSFELGEMLDILKLIARKTPENFWDYIPPEILQMISKEWWDKMTTYTENYSKLAPEDEFWGRMLEFQLKDSSCDKMWEALQEMTKK